MFSPASSSYIKDILIDPAHLLALEKPISDRAEHLANSNNNNTTFVKFTCVVNYINLLLLYLLSFMYVIACMLNRNSKRMQNINLCWYVSKEMHIFCF